MAVPILAVVSSPPLAFISASSIPIASVLRRGGPVDPRRRVPAVLYEQRTFVGSFRSGRRAERPADLTAGCLLAQRWMLSGLTAGGLKC